MPRRPTATGRPGSGCAQRSAISASMPCAWAWCPTQRDREAVAALMAATFPGLAPDEIAKTVGLAVGGLTGV